MYIGFLKARSRFSWYKVNATIIGNDPIIGNENFNHHSHLNLLDKKKKLVISKMNKLHSYRNDANL